MSAPATNHSHLPSPVENHADVALAVNDCWSRIGVAGDGTCKELAAHVHCRNCPVYADAGARLLDRSLTPGYRHDWALHFARPKLKVNPGAISEVLFRIGPEWMALPTAAFQEVVEQRKVHSIPHRRQGTLLGIVNIRGELLIAISLARLLGLTHDKRANAERGTTERLLVASWDNHRAVFPVDEVAGVHRFDVDQLSEPPATLTKSGTSYTHAIFHWQGRIVSCLDANLLFPALSQSIA